MASQGGGKAQEQRVHVRKHTINATDEEVATLHLHLGFVRASEPLTKVVRHLFEAEHKEVKPDEENVLEWAKGKYGPGQTAQRAMAESVWDINILGMKDLRRGVRTVLLLLFCFDPQGLNFMSSRSF
eukprot:m.178250 g.178250  ORF g.178250 m.178250 type:complete len:127 (+) comp14924_c0_seq1:305-685(+)